MGLGIKRKIFVWVLGSLLYVYFYLLIEAEVVVKLLDSNGDGLWGFENS